MLMASSSLKIRQYLLVTVIVCTFFFSSVSAGEEEDYEPLIGPIGKHPDAGDEGYGREGGDEDHGYEGGYENHGHEGSGGYSGGSTDPTHIVDGALQCFHGKHIYSHCDESCRLSPDGELHVPHEKVDEFCSGPCLEETNHLLDCIDEIMDHFEFYNRATTKDIRHTILAGCGHGYRRGNFNVGEYIEAYDEDGSIGSKATFSVLFGILVSFVGQVLVLM